MTVQGEEHSQIVPGTFRVLYPAPHHAVSTFLADRPNGASGRDVVLLQEVACPLHIPREALESWCAELRVLSDLRHPNLVPIRSAAIESGRAVFISEVIEGETLASLWAHQSVPQAPVAMRILLDLLSALYAVHRAAAEHGFRSVRGALTPFNVIVGQDGITRLSCVTPLRHPSVPVSFEQAGYLAPEELLSDPTADERADLFSAGVMLWELLAGQRLFPSMGVDAVVTALMAGKLVKPVLPEDASWAAPLAEICMEALRVNPLDRPASIAELENRIRATPYLKLATYRAVATFVAEAVGQQRSRPGFALSALSPKSEGTAPPMTVELPGSASPEQPTDSDAAALQPVTGAPLSRRRRGRWLAPLLAAAAVVAWLVVRNGATPMVARESSVSRAAVEPPETAPPAAPRDGLPEVNEPVISPEVAEPTAASSSPASTAPLKGRSLRPVAHPVHPGPAKTLHAPPAYDPGI